ncbi:myosin regulatory light chain 2-like [Ctenocephalides felis]|uniref:myosin regulatory light chain 2-like n=1 Tax=Ctenocephalides felis TaxID=7515 RepID=UPI000E6E44DE|nr:myosin regulatory light chain 2-like [Ctenocephalides felis]XP_026466284.1 myosin regulatory light chain 2-like [Ctenocephalides felis]
MADKEKKIKKKKAKEESGDAPAAEAAPAPAAAPAASERQSSRGSRKAVKRSGSNVFSMFSQKQVAEFKEAFQLIDHDKDGIIGKNDLRATFDELGRLVQEKELDDMIGEASGPINFTQLLTLFANRMSGSGGTDDDDVVINAFKTFDNDGKIDSDRLRHALMTWGDKFTAQEVDDAYDQMVIDDKGFIDTQKLIQMLTAAAEEDEEGGES